MNCAIAIFVKTPELSAVKTRLWPGIGRAAAEKLHVSSAAAVFSIVRRVSEQANIAGFWALAETTELSVAHWPGLLHVEQDQGPLGARMASVYRQLRKHHRGVILIGADAPQINAEALIEAADWLSSDQPRFAIGRAADGGFWLFGANENLADERWERPRYSRPTTADEFVRAISTGGEWLELETLHDLDTPEDIQPVRFELENLVNPSFEQREVALKLAFLVATMESMNE